MSTYNHIVTELDLHYLEWNTDEDEFPSDFHLRVFREVQELPYKITHVQVSFKRIWIAIEPEEVKDEGVDNLLAV